MTSKLGVKGIIAYKLIDREGRIKQEGCVENIVTEQGDKYYVDRLSDQGGSAAQIMVLGTGTTNVATANTWVGGYYAGNGTLTAGGGSVTILTNVGTAMNLQYVGTFAAGYATQNGITRVGLTNMLASADGNGTPNATTTFFIAHGTVTPTVNKGASDSLVVTWDHSFLGA